MPDLADIDVVRKTVAYATERGARMDAVLERLNIDPEDLDIEDGYLDAEQWYRLQVEAGQMLGDPLFGLHIAQHFSLRGYGLLGVLFETSANSREALELLSRVLPQFLPRNTLHVDVIKDVLRVTYNVSMKDAYTWAHRQEVIGGFYLNSQRNSGHTFTPRAVRLRQTEGSADELRAFFGVDVQLGAANDQLDLPLEDTLRPGTRADPVMLKLLTASIDTQLARRRAWAGRRASSLRLDGCMVDLVNGRVERGDGAVWLTSRERELLEFFAARSNKLVTHTEIERDVWKMVPSVVSHAPAVAVRRLRQKIEPEGTHPVNLLTVFGEGWKLVVRDN